MKYYLLLSFLAIGLLTACRKDIAPEPCTDPLNPNCVNYHPCNGTQAVTADFEMWYFGPALNQKIHEDSIFPPGAILFVAKLRDANYKWLIGNDTVTVQQDYRIFNGRFPGDSSIYGTYKNTLTVRKTPNISCYPNDLAVDERIRKITIVRPSQLQTTGIFKVLFDGYADSNIIQIQPWEQNFATNPNANKEVINNRIFIGFKDTRTDTLLTDGDNENFWFMNTIIYLGNYNGRLLPYGGAINVNPQNQTIEGNYKINILVNGKETIKQHHFKGIRL